MVISGVLMILAGVVWAMISKSQFDDYNELLLRDPTRARELSENFSTQRRDIFVGIGIAIVGVIAVASQVI